MIVIIMGKKSMWIVGVILILVIISGIYISNQTKDQSIVRIGVIVPLTGGLAEYGIAIKNGLELSKSDLNSDIELIFEDSKYDPKEAISAYNKLTTVDSVDLIINFGNPTTEALSPLAEQDKMVLIGFQAEDYVDGDYLIRSLKKPEEYMIEMLKYLEDYNTIGIVKTENAYLNALFDSLVENTETNRVVLVDNYQWGETDFRTSFSKIERGDYDIIGVFLGSGSIANFYKQRTEQGLNFETFGTDFLESLSEIENSGNTMDGVVYVNFVESNDFASTYFNQFKSKSQLAYAASSYDIFKFIELNYDKSRPLESLKEGTVDGVLGTYGIKITSDDQYFDYPIKLKTIDQGEIKVLI